MRKSVQYALGLVIGAALLLLFFRGVDLGELIAAVRGADPGPILLGTLLGLCTFLVRAVRWKYLLLRLGRVRIHSLFAAVCIGFMAITLLPGRVGEFLRAYVLGRREGLKVSSVFATVVLERILDAVTILVYFAFFLLVFRFPEEVSVEGGRFIAQLKSAAGWAAPVVLAAVGLTAFFIFRPALAPRWTEACLFFLPSGWRRKASRMVGSFVEGFSVFTDPRSLLQVAFHSLLLWLVIALGMWFVLLGFHIHLPLISIFVVVIIVAVGVAVPTPAGAGGYDYAFKVALVHIFGVEPNKAMAAILVCHAVSFVPVTFLGIGYSWREGLSLSRMRRMADEEGGPPPRGGAPEGEGGGR